MEWFSTKHMCILQDPTQGHQSSYFTSQIPKPGYWNISHFLPFLYLLPHTASAVFALLWAKIAKAVQTRAGFSTDVAYLDMSFPNLGQMVHSPLKTA